MSRGGDFWSRRKAGVEAEAEAERAAEVQAVEVALPETEIAARDDEVLAELNLCPPEELETTEAIKDFLQHDLPERLKARALRQLWRSNPVFANLDGLVDYGEDYTDAATVVGKLETVYQVGKGMLSAFTADDENDAAAEAEAEDAPQDGISEDEPAAAILAATADEEQPVVAADPVVAPQPPRDPEPIAAPARRMRFVFETA